jgi:hypothetical protein
VAGEARIEKIAKNIDFFCNKGRVDIFIVKGG